MARVRDDIETLIADGETLIKDGLRGARHVLRRNTRRGAAGDPVSRGVSSLARRVDGVFTLAERAALSLLRPDAAPRGRTSAAIADFADMLAEDDAGLSRRFVETHYRLARAVLGLWGLGDAFVSEQEVRLAFQMFLAKDRDLVAAARAGVRNGVPEERRRAVTEFAAAAALAILRREPVRIIGPGPFESGPMPDTGVPAFVAAAPSRAAFVSVALAVAGYAGRGQGTAEPEAFLVSAVTIVEARWARFSECRTPEQLAAEFRRVIPAMP